ncbi:hypothetical protein K7432_013564 [Basidiobolus ranarum]|uniref:FAS1 domain-containing protein n=1 Tax=Basidiobolus ranarum TaxID=34480 RepID=A0ABR2VQT0_9FUNG
MNYLYCVLILALVCISGTNSAQPLLTTIKENKQLSTLRSIITNSDGFQGLLSNINEYTLFAPSDKAFQEANITSADSAKFINLLKYHMIRGELNSTTLKPLQFPSTLLNDGLLVNLPENKPQVLDVRKNAQGIFVSNGIKNVQIVEADMEVSNGMVHIVDQILSPPISASEMMKIANLTSLLDLMKKSNFTNILDKLKGVTIFAPTNEALKVLDEIRPKGTALADMLKYHIVTSTIGYSVNLKNGTLPSLHGASLIIKNTDTTITVNNANLVTLNILTNNGVIHIVDAVLRPRSMAEENRASHSVTSAWCIISLLTIATFLSK